MYSMQYSFYELFWLFVVYSVAGWCIGVAVAAAKRKKFINTGVLTLPASKSANSFSKSSVFHFTIRK